MDDMTSQRAMKIEHINHALVAELHPPMYLMHMYWARKPSNVVSEWISHYSKEGEVVLDPFCGSGVAPIEAIKLKRKAIGIDLNPVAIFVSRMTAKPLDLQKYKHAFNQIKTNVKDKIYELYETRCPKCSQDGVIRWSVLDNNTITQLKYRCLVCQRKAGKKLLDKKPDDKDLKIFKKIERMDIPLWYPKNQLYYPNGRAFKEGTHIEEIDSIPKLFTKRNLIALSILYEEIKKIKDTDVRDLMKFTFLSMLHLASKMIPDRTSAGGPVWTAPRFWIPPRHREYNVWDTFETRVGKIIKGKTATDKNKIVKDYRETTDFKELKKCKANVMFICDDALEALRKIPDHSVDYVFTDPTYGGSIQYGELNYIWASWLGYGEDYLKKMQEDEVVINKEGQDKSFDIYYNMLYNIFKEVSRVLKPNGYMTVTFHNPSFEIRNALERACYVAGFDLENVVYQPPAAIPSSKSSLQPYGSVSGDFYFRFKNVKQVDRTLKEDEITFERVVVDATIRTIAERGEPTPMPIITNGIEPELCEHGFPFSKGKTVEDVLIEHVGKEFVVFDKDGKEVRKPSNISDKTLWLKEPERYLLDRVPLKERVEKSIVGLLLRKRKVTFTDIQKELYDLYRNSLTPNPPSIRFVLEEYAERVEHGLWKVKMLVEQREKQHDHIVSLLAEIGKKIGYDVYADLPKWRRSAHKLPVPKQNLKKVKEIDVIWYSPNEITHEFEVENTTGITEAIRRGANIPYEVDRFVVIPDERANRIYGKISEPYVKDGIEKYNWKFIYYDDLERFYEKNKHKKSLDIVDLKKIIKEVPTPKVQTQQILSGYE